MLFFFFCSDFFCNRFARSQCTRGQDRVQGHTRANSDICWSCNAQMLQIADLRRPTWGQVCLRSYWNSFLLFSGPFSACSIHVGPCAWRPSFSQHAWGGGCWRGSPANARRQGVRAGRVRARQHYTLRRGATQAGMRQRFAALRRPRCHSTSRPTLPLPQPGEAGTFAADNLDAPGVLHRHIQVHISQAHIPGHTCASLAAHPGECALKGDGAPGKDAGGGTRRSVITKHIKRPAASASPRCKWERQAQPAKEENAEVRTGECNILMCG